MIRRRLGHSDLEITSIGLGTWAIGGRQWGPQDDEASIGAIHAAIDHGIIEVGELPHRAAEAVFGDELEVARGAVEEIERGLRRLQIDGAVVQNLFQLGAKLIHLGMHVRECKLGPALAKPKPAMTGSTTRSRTN